MKQLIKEMFRELIIPLIALLLFAWLLWEILCLDI